jgi:beta-glucanase (GH16 family)
MKRRHILAAGVLVMAAVVPWSLGMPAGAISARAGASTVTTGQAANAIAPPSGTPVFSATFRGTRLNKKVWDTCYPFMKQGGCTNFGNKEYEWYMPSQVRVWGGYLRLVATRERTQGTTATGAPKTYFCRSGMVTSYPGFKFKYGFVQMVADVPHAAGLWPALWLAAANFSFPPEMDMIESWGVNHEEAAFFHPVGASWRKASIPLSLTKGWQTYSLRWTRTRITFYVGSHVVLTITKNVPHQLMYIVANVAEYVRPATGNCTGRMLIKSVKVWK